MVNVERVVSLSFQVGVRKQQKNSCSAGKEEPGTEHDGNADRRDDQEPSGSHKGRSEAKARNLGRSLGTDDSWDGAEAGASS